MKDNISVIGLGYVGLTLAISLSKAGYKVFGIEKDKTILSQLYKNKSHFHENKINEELKKVIQEKKLVISNNLNCVKDSKIIIITVGTPVGSSKKVILNNLFKLSKSLQRIVNSEPVIVIRSTVKIGITRKLKNEWVTKNKKAFFATCPERTVEGNALKEIKKLPQVIGTDSNYAKKELSKMFKKITNSIIYFNNFEQAEFLKLIDNTYRDTIFGYANELAKIGDHFGINASEVIKKVSVKYPRTNVASPGMVGGPCLTKDAYILIESMENKMNLPIISAARKTNENLPADFLKIIRTKKKQIGNVLILGLAFKGLPPTDDTRGSMTLPVINNLIKNNNKINIDILDNLVQKKNFSHPKCRLFNNMLNIKSNYDLILIINNNPYWKKIGLEKIKKKIKKNGFIFDFWNSFEKLTGKNYFALGSGKIKKL